MTSRRLLSKVNSYHLVLLFDLKQEVTMSKSAIGLGIILLLLFFVAANLVSSSTLHAQAPFYQGKSISLIIGNQAGGQYDLWARLIANHIGKQIPGTPTVIAQNMPAAGSLVAANYLYNVAKPDGLTIGAVIPGIYTDQLIGRKEAQFDWAKFNWIGTPEQTEWVFITRADSPYKSIEDIRSATEPPKCGTTGSGSFVHQVPKLLEEILGMKLTLVSGYAGGPDVDLALERGEVRCRAISVTAFFGREPYIAWAKKGFVRPLAQTGKTRDPSLEDVPTIYELMDQYKTSEIRRRLATVMLASNIFGRPWLAPPGVPAERVKNLRDAWNKTLKDTEFLAETKKRRWPVAPVAGEELDALAKQVITQPPEVVQRLKNFLVD
jgi:tripartite-type tricarboxylate transporter receptor subunit TctC